MEEVTREKYISCQQKSHHPNLKVNNCGLVISEHNNWVAATPDVIVHDPSNTAQPLGLLEIKNPCSFKDKDLDEACTSSSFYLEVDNANYTAHTRLGVTLLYIHQGTCILNIYIYRDSKWW